ncbi:hypothetical protein [Paeniglutamicibacter sp. Y32M11]|uniref:hypothetical protein n=1 Tax=Paeniglutamicibacter sp. Y32M11 TaxID=2853258 RepID=UPI001C52E930|nr:hypothetical protein [Paeniglutamicibacter sp. Y32M11]QXQ11481.1 hypothetical protein KUF55_06240 [Paeniglutamicibacter sp. Y32M11]
MNIPPDYEEDPRDAFRRLLGELRLVAPDHNAVSGPLVLLAEVSVRLQRELNELAGVLSQAPHAANREESARISLPSRFDAVAEMFKKNVVSRYDDFFILDQKLIDLFDGIREYLSLGDGESAYTAAMSSLAAVRQLTLEAQKRQAAETVHNWNRVMLEAEGASAGVLSGAKAALEQAISARTMTSNVNDDLSSASSELASIQERWKDLDSKLETQERRFAILNKDKAEQVLTSHFSTFEKGHTVRFGTNLGVGIALIAFGALFGIYQSVDVFGTWQPRSIYSAADVAWKIVIVSSLVGLGSYFLKQASTHRQLVVWAQAIGIQLQTFDAYTGLVDSPGQRSQLHAEFAKRIFGPEPTSHSGPWESAAPLPVVIDQLPFLEALLKANSSQKP